MGLILTRSPFHIGRGELDANASLTVQVARVNAGDILEIVDTYTLNFRNNLFIDVSSLCESVYQSKYSYVDVWSQYIREYRDSYYVNGYITVTLSGSINGVVQDNQVTNYFCSDGYVYSSEVIDKDFVHELQQNSFYAGSSDIIYKLDDANLRIPILNPTMHSIDFVGGVQQVNETVNVSFISKGEVVFTDTLNFYGIGGGQDTSSISRSARTFDYSSFLDRVNSNDGIMESSKCINDFFDEHRVDDIDEVYISSQYGVKILKVKTVEEFKYDPYRITFKNRYGLMEDLWFFKKSKKIGV